VHDIVCIHFLNLILLKPITKLGNSREAVKITLDQPMTQPTLLHLHHHVLDYLLTSSCFPRESTHHPAQVYQILTYCKQSPLFVTSQRRRQRVHFQPHMKMLGHRGMAFVSLADYNLANVEQSQGLRCKTFLTVAHVQGRHMCVYYPWLTLINCRVCEISRSWLLTV
jgi:hypothetical protein